jgi:hypothetical protein
MQHTKALAGYASAADFEKTMKNERSGKTPPPARAASHWRAFWRLQPASRAPAAPPAVGKCGGNSARAKSTTHLACSRRRLARTLGLKPAIPGTLNLRAGVHRRRRRGAFHSPGHRQSPRLRNRRDIVLGLCRRNRHRLAASASRGLVWIIEDKPGGESVDSIVHFRP